MRAFTLAPRYWNNKTAANRAKRWYKGSREAPSPSHNCLSTLQYTLLCQGILGWTGKRGHREQKLGCEPSLSNSYRWPTCGASAIASQSESCVGRRPILLHLYIDKATATRFPAIYASFCKGACSPCIFLKAEDKQVVWYECLETGLIHVWGKTHIGLINFVIVNSWWPLDSWTH